jgi:hypothetical protein
LVGGRQGWTGYLSPCEEKREERREEKRREKE